MKYSDARQIIKTGDLLAFTHTAWGSWHDFQIHMVRKATESEFAHVGIAYVIYDRVFILESVGSGVRLFPLSRSLPFYFVSNPSSLSGEALEWAFLHLGEPYESKVKMVLAELFNIDLKKNKRLQCSEYVNGILAANNQFLTNTDTPSAIVNAAMAQWGALSFVNN